MNRWIQGGLALACVSAMGAGVFVGVAGAHGGMVLPEGEYTAEQEAWAMDIVHRTEEALPETTTGEELRAKGYQNFGVASPDGYWHWTNPAFIDDGKLLDPSAPESLVIRSTPDGLVVEAAMYFLDSEHTMDAIPEDLQWIPGWHSHNDELCHNDDGTFAGLQYEGTCSVGKPADTPPMMHVWTVDTPCGHRFAGIGIFGIDCLGHGGHGGHGGGTTPGTWVGPYPGPFPGGTYPGPYPGPGPEDPPLTVPGNGSNGNGSNGNGTGPITAVRPATAVRATPTFAG